MSEHEFFDPDGTGVCQARPVYLAIPGAIERKCEMTAAQHEEPPTGIEERIAEVLVGNFPWANDSGLIDVPPLENLTLSEWAAHVAAVVAQALALNGDWREQVTTRDAIREEFYKVVREENAAAEQKLAAIRKVLMDCSGKRTDMINAHNEVLAIIDSDDTPREKP